MPERRRRQRREQDIEREEIVHGAVEVTPLVTRLLKAWKLTVAMMGLGGIVGGAAVALGFRILTPATVNAQVVDQVQKNRKDIDSLSRRGDRVEAKIDALVRVACVNPVLTERDKYLARLNCAEALSPALSPGTAP